MPSDQASPGPGPSTLSKQQSQSKMSRLTLVRSTDAHPPHHAHFDISEGDSNQSEEDIHHEPHHRSPNAKKSVIDIEHVPVDDDPREWSNKKKNFVLGLLTLSVLGPLIAPSIYNPVIDQVMSDLNASQIQIGLSISLYILFQGTIPVIWASVAEITGRKIIYLASYALYVIGATVASRSQNMPLFIGMRCLQACGSSAVVAVGAGSLADMFETHERGQKLGIFYGMPLVGPAIGPLIGGALGNAFGWRSCMYFLTAYAAICLALFCFFPDTWRKERSRVYQKAMERAVKRAILHDEAKEKKRQRKISKGLDSNAPTPPTTGLPSPALSRRPSLSEGASTEGQDSAATLAVAAEKRVDVDLEKGEVKLQSRRNWGLFGKKTQEEHEKIRPNWRDVNPLPTMWSIVHQPTNAALLPASGILFAAQYTIVYTASVTLSKAPYSYNALNIGLVLLSFGVGNMAGSVFGGRYSDIVLRKLKAKNNGVSVPEMRLKSFLPAVPVVVGSFLAYGWTANQHCHVSALIITLFFGGCSLMVIYTSTLAYLVDSNPGRSAGAVSCNSFIRGSMGCVLSQVAIPIQESIGDGGLYTIVAGLLALSCCTLLFVGVVGERWRSNGFSLKFNNTNLERASEGEKKNAASSDSEVASKKSSREKA